MRVIETIETATGRDISYTPRLIEGRQAIIQRAIERLLFHRGEAPHDANQGIPYFDGILGRRPELVHQKVASELRNAGIEVNQVSVSIDSNTRTMTVSITISDEPITLTVAQ